MINYKKYGWRGYMWPVMALSGFAAIIGTLNFIDAYPLAILGLWVVTGVSFWLMPKGLHKDITEDERRSYPYRP